MQRYMQRFVSLVFGDWNWSWTPWDYRTKLRSWGISDESTNTMKQLAMFLLSHLLYVQASTDMHFGILS